MIRLRPRRGGMTLIDVLVVITSTSFVLGAVAMALNAMYKMDAQVREDVSTLQNLGRLSVTLRSDAHAAAAASLTSSEQQPNVESLHLTMERGRTIIYRFATGEVVREVHDENGLLHRDAFAVHADVTPRWRLDTASIPPVASLTISATTRHEANVVLTHIEAVVGLQSTPDGSQP